MLEVSAEHHASLPFLNEWVEEIPVYLLCRANELLAEKLQLSPRQRKTATNPMVRWHTAQSRDVFIKS